MASAASLFPPRISSMRPLLERAPRVRRALGPLGLLLAWQLASSAGLISPRVLAAPTTVLATAWQLLSSGELQNHLLVSLGRVARGLAIGVSVGLLLAVPAGLFRLCEDLSPSSRWARSSRST